MEFILSDIFGPFFLTQPQVDPSAVVVVVVVALVVVWGEREDLLSES